MASEEEKQIEAYLQGEATQFQREQEVERVLACFKMDPFAILQLPYQFVEKDVKMTYRRKSLLIHPDKTKHPRAQEAFELLKRAETELTDEKKRNWLLQLVAEAQHLMRQSAGNQLDEESTSFKDGVRNKLKELLIDEELRRRRLLKKEMERESNEARKLVEEIEKRKRKRQADKDWEDTRDKRVGNWRNFMTGKKKKKRKELRPPKILSEDASKPYIKRPSAS
jgi:DnaJ family protein C protein 8